MTYFFLQGHYLILPKQPTTGNQLFKWLRIMGKPLIQTVIPDFYLFFLCISIAGINSDQKLLEKDRVYLAYTFPSLSITVVNRGRNSRQEFRGWKGNSHAGALLTGLLHLLSYTVQGYLFRSGTLTERTRPSHIYHSSKQVVRRLAYRLI